MQVLMVVPWAGVDAGGAAAAAVTSARLLASAGHRVTLAATDAATPSNAAGDARLTRAAIAEIEARLHPATLALFPAGRPRRLAWSRPLDRWLDGAAAHSDVVHAHTLWLRPTAAASAAARRHGTPLLAWPHGALSPAFARRGRVRKLVTMHAFQRAALEGAAGIVVASALEAAWSAEIAPDVPRLVVPHAVDVEPSGGPAPRTASRTGPRTGPTLLWAGRLGPVKRPDLAIRLLARLPEHVTLQLVGPDGSGLRPGLEALARSLGVDGRIEWTGALPRAALHAAMREARLVLVTSDSENFSLVAAEAASLGTPVATRAGVGIAELLRATGAGVILPESLDASAASLRAILEEPGWTRAVEACDGVRRALAPGAVARRLAEITAAAAA